MTHTSSNGELYTRHYRLCDAGFKPPRYAHSLSRWAPRNEWDECCVT